MIDCLKNIQFWAKVAKVSVKCSSHDRLLVINCLKCSCDRVLGYREHSVYTLYTDSIRYLDRYIPTYYNRLYIIIYTTAHIKFVLSLTEGARYAFILRVYIHIFIYYL